MRDRMATPRAQLLRLAALFGGEAAATMILVATDVLPVWAGLAHHVAMPPFDLFADVRLLIGRSSGWAWFTVGAASSIAIRSAGLTWAIGGGRRSLRRVLAVYLAATPFGLAGGVLAYSALAVLYSLFLWVALPMLVAVALVLGPLPWRPVSPVGSAAVALYALVLLVVSGVAAAGDGWAMAAVPVSAAATVVGVQVVRRADRVLLLAAPLATAMAALAVLVTTGVEEATGDPPAREGSLFIVAGVGGSSGTASMFRLDPTSLGYTCEQTTYFSYAGSGTGAPQRRARCPITTGAPYRPTHTRAPFDVLVDRMRAQLAGLERPVVVATHSQGAWILTASIDEPGAADIDRVVMLGPFPRHEVGYPAPGIGAPGQVGADAMRELLDLLHDRGHTSFRPDAPLYQDLLTAPSRVGDVMARAPTAPTLAVSALLDVPILPEGWRLPGAANECVAAHHGHLPTSRRVHELVNRFLAGDTPSCEWWRVAPFAVAEAFGVPPS